MVILKKHGMEKCDTVRTPMATTKLDADLQGTLVDQTKYRSMIGGLMYLTASRPDIAFATFVCARYQARPTEKYLKEAKRIFRYLRQSINMGLWYSKDSGFELIAYADADHAGCNENYKSTSGGIQFLGDKLVIWSSKKQDCTAMSSAEAETEYQLADLFTKALPKERFEFLVHKIEEIKEEFDKLVQQIDTFVPINLEATKATLKRYREELQTKTSKKQSAQEDSETDKEESVEAMNPTPLTTKSDSVVNWKIFQQGQRSIYQIIRANGADTVYMSFGAMIKDFTRENLIELYRLATPEQTATGKENSNLLIADSLLKTISCEEKTKTKRQIGVDPNNGIYPLAYAIVESENNSWKWFLDCLGDDLELFRNSNITFISDRTKGVIPATAEIFPSAEHRFCLKHIYDNMKEGVGIKRPLDDLRVTAAKVSMSFEDRMEQYIQMIDYSLWEVIENGNAPPIKKKFKLPLKRCKSLLQAIEKRFGGNAATKKTQRNLLKQQYENFTASCSEV
ncbi:retrovirus-related pol polyprotein from transposon TNT 1-94 [Tanacetum coccineum]